MTDDFVSGRLIDCQQCGRKVRLYGHNNVTEWTCEPCRNGHPASLLDEQRDETNERYDPTISSFPY